MLRNYQRRVVESLSIAVLVLDRRLRLLFMNPAAETLFELSFRKAQRLGLSELVIGAESFIAGLRHCLESGHPYIERELQLTFPLKRIVTVDCTAAPLLERDPPTELLLELRQVDWRLRINREEHILAQHHTTQTLVRNLAHEIKNPLGGLRGAAQLLERELPDPALREYTGIIIGEADRLRNLVDRMLGPNRLLIHGEVSVHEILERVCGLVEAEACPGIRIERDYDPSIPPLWGDADRLIQAVLNVVRNAAQALRARGRGVITLRTRVQRQYTIGTKRHKLVARLDVVDDGPGIPPTQQERIFYPMISGRPDGTGLGLSIAQSIIAQHGGLIECVSRPGETIFTLLLPLGRTG
ncbi:MAG: nitrogen regulation protein NR(II) [Candidatus Contendobacter sp.]|nr:nitrogen regulation protein NR(II) [Candidatus Contendobacter sp.]MDS4060731.1 nitrogen regulation protein NR(II) [Candidatus Contendobacter sp.]